MRAELSSFWGTDSGKPLLSQSLDRKRAFASQGEVSTSGLCVSTACIHVHTDLHCVSLVSKTVTSISVKPRSRTSPIRAFWSPNMYQALLQGLILTLLALLFSPLAKANCGSERGRNLTEVTGQRHSRARTQGSRLQVWWFPLELLLPLHSWLTRAHLWRSSSGRLGCSWRCYASSLIVSPHRPGGREDVF